MGNRKHKHKLSSTFEPSNSHDIKGGGFRAIRVQVRSRGRHVCFVPIPSGAVGTDLANPLLRNFMVGPRLGKALTRLWPVIEDPAPP